MNNITLTPTGDILIEGIKVGEYSPCPFIPNGYDVSMQGYPDNIYSFSVLEDINLLLTNGFTPKKWKE